MRNAKSYGALTAIALTILAWTVPKPSLMAQGEQKPLKGQPGKERMEEIRLQIANVRSNVFLTLLELDRVRGERGPERPRFQAFTAQLATMQELAKTFGQRAEEVKRKGNSYFANWESELRTEKKSDPRYEERKHSYELINTFMQNAKTNFLDFNNILMEIKTLLEKDPSAASVAKAKDLFGTANWRCIDVQRSLAYMEIEFDRLADSFAKDE
jgi:hypothetical protein